MEKVEYTVERYNKKRGRHKYKIPYDYKDFIADDKKVLETYLPELISAFETDKKEIKRLKDVKLGVQNIYSSLKDQVLYFGTQSKTDQNELWAVTNFWKDSLISEPITYSLKTSDDTDDIAILNRYFTDVGKDVKDNKAINDAITTGVGFQYVIPSTKLNIDIEYEAPFHLAYLDNEKAFLVYSTGILEEVLFSCVYTQTIDNDGLEVDNYTIYYPEYTTLFKNLTGSLEHISTVKQPFNFQPVVEYTMNPERIGVISPIESLQDLENDINSKQLDLLHQQSNPPLVLINVKLQVKPGETIEQTYARIRKTNTIAAQSDGMEKPEIYYLEQKQDTSSSTTTFERVNKALYDISATPQASGNVSSGGDTGQARAFGNGWQNSFLRAKSYITFFRATQTKLLKNVLECCKLNGERNPLKNAHATDIDVSFNTSVFDSILIKAQAFVNLINAGVSVQEAAKSTNITKDPATFAKKAEDQAEKEQAKLEAQTLLESQVTTETKTE